MKKYVVSALFLCSILMTTPASASVSQLLKDVDQLSPEEASVLVRKLAAKMSDPLPESLFTGLGFSYGWTGQVVRLGNLSTAGMSSIYAMYGNSAQVGVHVTPDTSIGMDLGWSQGRAIRENVTNVFRDTNVEQFYIHGFWQKALWVDHGLAIEGIVGAGMTYGKYELAVIDENSGGTSQFTRRNGSAFSYQFGLNAAYRLSSFWELGMGIKWMSATISELKNPAGFKDASAPTLDFSGTMARIYTSVNL